MKAEAVLGSRDVQEMRKVLQDSAGQRLHLLLAAELARGPGGSRTLLLVAVITT